MTSLGVERGNAVDLQGLADSPAAVRSKKPKWTQFRFVAGVLLVIASVLTGAKIIAGADQSSIALVAARPLTAGMTISQSDVRPIKVRFYGDPDRYFSGNIPPGYVMLRPIGEGELVPRTAVGLVSDLAAAGSVPVRYVTVPITNGHFPPGVQRGDVVDIYSSTQGGGTGATTSLLLSGVTVDRAPGPQSGGLGGGSAGGSVVLVIPEQRVTDMVIALQRSSLDIVLSAQNRPR